MYWALPHGNTALCGFLMEVVPAEATGLFHGRSLCVEALSKGGRSSRCNHAARPFIFMLGQQGLVQITHHLIRVGFHPHTAPRDPPTRDTRQGIAARVQGREDPTAVFTEHMVAAVGVRKKRSKRRRQRVSPRRGLARCVPTYTVGSACQGRRGSF